MNKKIWIGLIVVVALVVAAVLIKNHTKPVEGVIKIGAPMALTGDAAVWGEAEKNAIDMAIEEINAAGGVRGKKLQVVYDDIKSVNQSTVSAISKMLTVDKVSYIIGPTWADTYMAAHPLSDQYNTIFLAPSAGITTVHNGEQFFKNFFSTWYRSDFQGKNYLKMVNKENIKSLYILVQNDAYYTDFSNYLGSAAKAVDAEVMFNRVPLHSTDFRTKLLEIKNKKPDMVFVGFGSDQEYGALYRQRKEMGMQDIPFYNSELIAEFGPNPEYKELLKNTYYVGFEPIPGDFAKKYKAKFNVDPVFAASITYDTVYILKDAIEHTDGSTDAVRAYLESHNFNTITYGKVGFDDIHGVNKTTLDVFKYNSELGDYEIMKQ